MKPKLDKEFVYAYGWSFDDEDTQLIINIYCVNENNESIVVSVEDFQVYCFIELPTKIYWTTAKIEALSDKLDTLSMVANRPLSKKFVKRRKQYGANIQKIERADKKDNKENKKYEQILFPFLELGFRSSKAMQKYLWAIKKDLSVSGLGKIKLKAYEHDNHITPYIKLQVKQNLPACGWISIEGYKKKGKEGKVSKEKSTVAIKEYSCEYSKVKRVDQSEPIYKKIPKFRVLCFDCEMYSENYNRMPNAFNPSDEMFQIGFVTSSKKKECQRYLYTLKKCGAIEHTIVKCFETERELLVAFKDFLSAYDPHIITGYNILSFDFKYMFRRSKQSFAMCFDSFRRFDINPNKKCEVVGLDEKENSGFQSKAFGKFEMIYPKCNKINIDAFVYCRKGFKLANYKLDTVLANFGLPLKVPLKPREMFRLYKEGTVKGITTIGEYCVNDAYTTWLLFEKLQLEIDFQKNSEVDCIPMNYLTTQGQQIKMSCSILQKTRDEKIVCEFRKEFPQEEYTGATVVAPRAGIYTNVATLDFASLYPSIMEAFNICYTSHVSQADIDSGRIDIADCNVQEWSMHQNCEHDENKQEVIGRKKVKIICEDHKTYFLKREIFGPGIVPKILRELLDKRKLAKAEIKELNKLLYATYNEYVLKIAPKTDIKPYDPDKLDEFIQVYKKIIDRDSKNASKEEYNKFTEKSDDIELNLVVKDKQQNAFKVSANSKYGAMGVKRGQLPLPDGAKTVTYIGRRSINEMLEYSIKYKGALKVYGDTDSCMLQFPYAKTFSEIFDIATSISEHSRKVFPKPMSLEFEGEIYHKFLILSKKRYICRKINKDGVLNRKRNEKGVILTRRDNCSFARSIYSVTVDDIFEKIEQFVDFYLIMELINEKDNIKTIRAFYLVDGKKVPFEDINKSKKLKEIIYYFCNIHSTHPSYKDIVTGSLGHFAYSDKTHAFSLQTIIINDMIKPSTQINVEAFIEGLIKFKASKKVILDNVNDYILSLFNKKKPEGVKDKKLPYYTWKDFFITQGLTKDVDEYKFKPHKNCKDINNCEKGGRCLEHFSGIPAHVVLAKKMIERGTPMIAGDRIEYLPIMQHFDKKEKDIKKFERIEHIDYYLQYSSLLRIDYLYLMEKQIIKPLDELLNVGLHEENYVGKIYEYHKNKQAVVHSIRDLCYESRIKKIDKLL